MGVSEEELLRNAAKESCIGCRLPAMLGKRSGNFIACKGCTDEEAEAIADAWKKETLREHSKTDKKAKKTNKPKILEELKAVDDGFPTFCGVAEYLGAPCGTRPCNACGDSVVAALLREWEKSLNEVKNG